MDDYDTKTDLPSSAHKWVIKYDDRIIAVGPDLKLVLSNAVRLVGEKKFAIFKVIA